MEFSETLGFDAHTHSARILCGLYIFAAGGGLGLQHFLEIKSGKFDLDFFKRPGPWQFQQSDWS
jgi:hypothetical protein